MLRDQPARCRCLRCGEPGTHGTDNQCIAALTKAVVAERASIQAAPKGPDHRDDPLAPDRHRRIPDARRHLRVLRRIARAGRIYPYVVKTFETLSDAMVWIQRTRQRRLRRGDTPYQYWVDDAAWMALALVRPEARRQERRLRALAVRPR